MVKALFDTNILVDYLNGIPQARDEIGRYADKAISVITWMEVLVGAAPDVEAATRSFLESFAIIPLDNGVAQRAVEIRKTRRIKLPDAIIWATADQHSMLLITRNTKDFPADSPGVRLPYQI